MNKEKGKHLETHLHQTMLHGCPKWAATPASRSTQGQSPARMDSPAWLPVLGSAGNVNLGRKLVFAWLCLKALIAA